ncbi:hypothetical protein T190_02050 [Sinorhizobium meliloti CCBAU 01290]|nr:hypothetical protein T190_02050 [Sinorhizobium meliloti CCBAU 01290]
MRAMFRFIGNGADPEHVFFHRVPFTVFGCSFLHQCGAIFCTSLAAFLCRYDYFTNPCARFILSR